jgi:hypothetical protein
MDPATAALVLECLPAAPDGLPPAAVLRACLACGAHLAPGALVELLQRYAECQAWAQAYDVVGLATELGALDEVVGRLKAAGQERLLLMLLMSAQQSAAIAGGGGGGL